MLLRKLCPGRCVGLHVELALVLKALWCRKRLLVLGFLLSAVPPLLAIYRVNSLVPFSFHKRALTHYASAAEAYVDGNQSFVGNIAVSTDALVPRATTYANLMAGPAGVQLAARYSGVPADQLYASGPVDPDEMRVEQEPIATERNVQIWGESRPYQLDFYVDQHLPIVYVYAQAPTARLAYSLATGAITGLRHYVSGVEGQQHVSVGQRVLIRQIGHASVGVVDPGVGKKLAGLIYLLTLLGWCVIVLLVVRLRARWRAIGTGETAHAIIYLASLLRQDALLSELDDPQVQGDLQWWDQTRQQLLAGSEEEVTA